MNNSKRESLYKPLSTADVEKIAQAAFRILAESGVAVYSDTAFSAFKRAGAQVDEDTRRVYLSQEMVEHAVETVPSALTLYSRDGKWDLELEKNNVHYSTGGTAIYVLDPDSGQCRPSTTEDVILNAHLVDVLDHIHSFTINVFPNEIKEQDDIDINRFFHALDHTSKHVMGGIYSLTGCKKVVEMAEIIAGSPEKLRAEPFISFITLMISPFKIDKEYGEMTCYLAQQGLPVVIPTEPICGTTSPITLASNVLTHTAETLAGICLVQCINPKAPAICGSVGSITNLQNMDHLGGPIERGMIHAAVAQMAQYFAIPLYSTAGTSDSKVVDIQAAYESSLSSLLVAMSGANYIHDIAGLMESDLTVAYEKLVMDNEILGMIDRVLRGIQVNDDTLATDLIIEKGPGGEFITAEHTLRYMKEEFFVPQLANREKRTKRGYGQTALQKAQEFIQKERENLETSRLRPEVRKEILSRFHEIKVD